MLLVCCHAVNVCQRLGLLMCNRATTLGIYKCHGHVDACCCWLLSAVCWHCRWVIARSPNFFSHTVITTA